MEKNKLMMIIIIVLLVVLLASVGAVTFFAYKMLSQSGSEQEENASTSAVSQAMLTPEHMVTFSLSNTIATNLADGPDGAKHVIRSGITIAINATDTKDKDFIKLTTETLPSNEKIIASFCIDIFRSKTYEEVSMIGSKDQLQDEILSKLQEVFNTNLIVAVYLDEMIQN